MAADRGGRTEGGRGRGIRGGWAEAAVVEAHARHARVAHHLLLSPLSPIHTCSLPKYAAAAPSPALLDSCTR